MSSWSKYVTPLLAWTALALVAVLAISAQRPPQARGLTAPPTAFSAARAKAQLARFATRPHPIGSAANARVRETLAQTLRDLGAQVQLETGVGTFRRGRHISAGRVHNIVARIAGSEGGRDVMLTAHYDSVRYGPGAADDGAGVATILETLRALRAGPPLKRDVRVVLTDGEEAGLLGADAYVTAHPNLHHEVGVVLNFEARGSSGPVNMFETSADNGWLVRQLAAAAPYPVASSLMVALYKQLPNDTDLTVFKRAGLAGMNFAFAGGFEDYHTPLDNLGRLDPDSVQHMGSYALALTRRLGNMPLTQVRAPDRIYFDWLGSHLIQYPHGVMWLALLVAVALFTAAVWIERRRQRLRYARVAAGLGGGVALLLVPLALSYVVWRLLSTLIGERLLFADTPSNGWLSLGLLLVALAASMPLWRLCNHRDRADTALGSMLVFGLLMAFVCFTLPGASFLLQWPLIAMLVGLLLAQRSARAPLHVLWLALGAVPAVLLFAPLIDSMRVLLGMTGAAVIAGGVLLGLLLMVCAPLLGRLARGWKLAAPLLLAGAVACFAVGAALSHFSPQHPRRDGLGYSVDADSGTAAWVSRDAATDALTAQFFGPQPTRGPAPRFTFGSEQPVMTHAAPVLPMAPPRATVTANHAADGIRSVSLHLASPRHARMIALRLPGETRLLSLEWDGHAPLTQLADVKAAGPWTLAWYAPSPVGVDLTLKLAGNAPLACRLADRSVGLPAMAAPRLAAQPGAVLVYDGTTISRRCAF